VSDRAAVIVGAGPTELMLAGELALAGVDVVIVERCASQHADGSRARGLNPRTFEVPLPCNRRRPASRVKIGWHRGRAGAGSGGSGRLAAGKVDEVVEDVGVILRVTIGGDPGIARQGAGRVAILPRPRHPARQALQTITQC